MSKVEVMVYMVIMVFVLMGGMVLGFYVGTLAIARCPW